MSQCYKSMTDACKSQYFKIRLYIWFYQSKWFFDFEALLLLNIARKM